MQEFSEEAVSSLRAHLPLAFRDGSQTGRRGALVRSTVLCFHRSHYNTRGGGGGGGGCRRRRGRGHYPPSHSSECASKNSIHLRYQL